MRLILLLVLCGFASANYAADLAPHQPYQGRKSNPVTYEIDFAAVVTAPYQTKVLKVWLPMATSDAIQEVTDGTFTTFPQQVKPQIGVEKKFGNKMAYFEFKDPQGAQIIRRKFTVKTHEVHWDINPEKVETPKVWPGSFATYLESDRSVAVSDPLRNLLATVVPNRKDPASDLACVLDWVNANITYDHKDASLKASASHALEKRRGHCSDYHGLCAAFGRALGFPTRVTYGLNTFPKNGPSHCKLEAYLPPYGWVSFDVSETQKLIADIEKNASLSKEEKSKLAMAANERMRKGFRDNTWFLQSRGTDYDLVPLASQRVAVIRTMYAEADGMALPDPDPNTKGKTEFAWMTAHEYKASKPVTYPFKDIQSLR